MLRHKRIAGCLLTLALLAASALVLQGQQYPGEFRNVRSMEEMPPFTETGRLRLTLDANRSYVLGTDPPVLRVTLSTSDPAMDGNFLWRANYPQRVMSGFTYTITGPDGGTQLVQTCRTGENNWNTTKGVSVKNSFSEEIDLSRSKCFDYRLTQPGHYAVKVEFVRPICLSPARYGCRIDEEHGEYYRLTIDSNTVEFDVLPAYSAENPAPTAETPPATADPLVHAWLNSGNPRLEAWAAYYIQRDHTVGGASELQAWFESPTVENWLPTTIRPVSALDTERSQTAHEVLDGLIQAHVQLSTEQIRKVAENDLTLGLIFAMLPKWNEAAVLDIFNHAGGFKSDRNAYAASIYQRTFAGDALAASGSRAFLDEIKAGFVPHLSFLVRPMKHGPGFGGGGPACGDGYVGRADLVPGWPPMGNYGLTAGIPKQVYDETTDTPHYTTLSPASYVSLGVGDLYYTRVVSQHYGSAVFSMACNRGSDEELRWVEQYGRHGEHLETGQTFYVSGNEDYRIQLRKWVAGLGAAYAEILADAGSEATPLKVTLYGTDYVHPAKGSNASNVTTFDFAGFPPAGVTVVPW